MIDTSAVEGHGELINPCVYAAVGDAAGWRVLFRRHALKGQGELWESYAKRLEPSVQVTSP